MKMTTSAKRAQIEVKKLKILSKFARKRNFSTYRFNSEDVVDASSVKRAKQEGLNEEEAMEKRRQLYACEDNYVTLNDMITLPQYYTVNKLTSSSQAKYQVNSAINERISIWKGDMTTLEIDAVVNAANESLMGGGGIDGAIHSAAGPQLAKYNRTLGGCDTGNTVISPGFRLPSKWILSTVGPRGEKPAQLKSCYQTILNLVEKHEIKSVAFCCVSTGIFGYPLENATHIALDTVRSWMQTNDNYKKVDRIIFVTFLPKEVATYNKLIPIYFPCTESIPCSE